MAFIKMGKNRWLNPQNVLSVERVQDGGRDVVKIVYVGGREHLQPFESTTESFRQSVMPGYAKEDAK